MGCEHERWIKHLIELRLITEGYNPNEETKAVEELEETYAKAKAFNEISQVFKKVTIYNTATALEVKEIIDELEDK